jgi:arginyl-tRNA synthetase
MKKNIQEEIISLIKDSLSTLTDDPNLTGGVMLDLPQEARFGDFSTNIAMRLSKPFNKPPGQIALKLISSFNSCLNKSWIKEYISEVKAEGAGFINFYLSNKYLYDSLRCILEEGSSALRSDLGKQKPVLIEFVSANPTGPLSVAHARQAAVGDALANILEFSGFRPSREYYLNDEGNQIIILGRSVELRMKELSGEAVDFPQEYYQGSYIYDIAKDAVKKNIPLVELGDFAAGQILSIIKDELEDFGVKFDCWYSQKELGKSSKITIAFDKLKEKGYLYEKDGALWFKSTFFGDDKDRVVVKSDGAYTYLAPDIAYHNDKYGRGFKWLINLWGPDHHGYINRVKAAVSAFEKDPETLSILIVQLATIFRAGKPVQISTRKGEYITLREVLEEVGKDAARFFFISRRISSHLDFDLDTAKKQTSENPVYYIQYAHARICSILHNSLDKLGKNIDFNLLVEKEEIILIRKLLQFSWILNICLSTLDPYMMTIYLQELSEAFHKFYDNHRVLTGEPELTQARLALISGVKIVIATGLNLLGISSPEKM